MAKGTSFETKDDAMAILDPRMFTSSVLDLITMIGEKIEKTSKPEDFDPVNWHILSDALNDAGCSYFDEVLFYLRDNKRVPYNYPNKIWCWFVPHQNNTMENYEQALTAYHYSIPILYRDCRNKGMECFCIDHTFEAVLYRLFATVKVQHDSLA